MLAFLCILWLIIKSDDVVTAMPSGHPMNRYEKEMVVSIYKWLSARETVISTTSTIQSIAGMTQLNRKTISNILRQYKKRGNVFDSNWRRPGRQKFRAIDNFTRAAVRNTVHAFYSRNESPTLTSIHEKLHEDPAYKFSRTTTSQVLYKTVQQNVSDEEPAAIGARRLPKNYRSRQ